MLHELERFASSTWDQRVETIALLASRWRGPFEIAGPGSADTVLGRFWELLRANVDAICGYNRLVAPHTPSSDGVHVIATEHQGVYAWGISKLGSPDPNVHGRFSHEPGWVDLEVSLSTFLLQFVLVEATFGAPLNASESYVTTECAASLTKGLTPVTGAPWMWPAPPAQLYFGRDLLVFMCPNPSDGKEWFSVWVGALSQEGLEPVRAYIGSDWETLMVDG